RAGTTARFKNSWTLAATAGSRAGSWTATTRRARATPRPSRVNPWARLRVKGGVEMDVTYCVNPPAIPIDSMVYETVLGRFSGRQPKGTIDAERATRYKRSDYTVKTAESYALQRWGMGYTERWTKMINQKKEKGTDKPIKLPKKNAVLIWIEPKPKKK
ncbi:hypothetical protein THAOC_14257, partial [Thalassiosira oceanica]